MRILTASGSLEDIRAAADALEANDPSPIDAVSWFEEGHGRFRIELYLAEDENEDEARALFEEAAPGLHLHAAALEDADWVAMALDGLPPVRAGRFVIAGAHALNAIHGGRRKIWIEASEAFGTGHHGTTLGCLTLMERLLRRRHVARVLDVGTGSGVLAIAAARTGARALGVEIDHRAAQIAAVNVRNNRVGPRVRIVAGDGARHALGSYDLVFANILFRPLVGLAPRLVAAVAPGGSLILSGLLAKQEPLARAAFESRGLVLTDRFQREGWLSLHLQRRERMPVRDHARTGGA
jgi:ribosomal protein L11 methyltransferase